MLTITENSNLPQDMAFDLRQRYANIVGDHLEIAATRRINNKDYYAWFKALRHLKVVVSHKFKDKDEAIKKYDLLINRIRDLANKNPGTWVGQDNNPQKIEAIEEALAKLEEFIYEEMHKAKMFGEGSRIVSF